MFEIRGVVEGFYGNPWSHNSRLTAIKRLSSFNFNSYMYCPKDAAWQRAKWRNNLDSELRQQMSETALVCKENGIDLCLCVSPGLDIVYSSESDRQYALDKFTSYLDLGATQIGLLWDDIDWDLTQAEDISKYEFVEDAQAEFSNWIFEKIKDHPNLKKMIVCPMIYWGRGHNLYIQRLGSLLHQDIGLMWTGRQVRSEYIDTVDAEQFAKQAKRKAIYWDNFPVNNLSLRHELHMGPVKNRESNLDTAAMGLYSNPMLQPNLSLLPLATVGKYLSDPKNYSPEDAWAQAMNELYPKQEAREALQTFFGCLLSSPIDSNGAPELSRTLSKALTFARSGQLAEAAEIVTSYQMKISSSIKMIEKPDFAYQELRAEFFPWFNKYLIADNLLSSIISYLQLPNTENYLVIEKLFEDFESNRYVVCGDAFFEFINELRNLNLDNH